LLTDLTNDSHTDQEEDEGGGAAAAAAAAPIDPNFATPPPPFPLILPGPKSRRTHLWIVLLCCRRDSFFSVFVFVSRARSLPEMSPNPNPNFILYFEKKKKANKVSE
jgi:hypothetical protein